MSRASLAVAVAVAVGAFAATVAAVPAAFAAEPCLHAHAILGYKTLDRHTIIVRATGGKRYRLDVGGDCIGLDDVIALGVRQRGGGMCVEVGDSITYSFSGFGRQSCLITGVSLYASPPASEGSGSRP